VVTNINPKEMKEDWGTAKQSQKYHGEMLAGFRFLVLVLVLKLLLVLRSTDLIDLRGSRNVSLLAEEMI
jgi:hypothetical protein